MKPRQISQHDTSTVRSHQIGHSHRMTGATRPSVARPETIRPITNANQHASVRPVSPRTTKAPACTVQAAGALQRKTFVSSPQRPHPVPKVMQAKFINTQQSHIVQTPRRSVAPPVYRPEQRSIVQPKVILQPRKPPTAPPVYRPELKKIVQPKMAAVTPAHRSPNAPQVYRPQPTPKVLQTKSSRKAGANLTLQAKPATGNDARSLFRLAHGASARGRGQSQVNNRMPSGNMRPNVVQAVWVNDPDSPYYFWTPPVEGVKWFADKKNPDQMFFEVLGPKSSGKYGRLAGKENQRTREAWVRLHGSDPMIRAENPAPISVDQLKRDIAQDLRKFEECQKKGMDRYGRLASAKRALTRETAEDRDQFYRNQYYNGQFGARDYEPGTEVNLMAVFLQERPSLFKEGRLMTKEEQWRDPPKTGQYKNMFDLASGTIVADQNYGHQETYFDRSTGKKESFNNSEVLFQQWRDARKIMHHHARERLEVLRRAHVAGDGIPVVKAVRTWLLQNDREYDAMSDFTFPKGHPCFFALLAAANCAAAIFLIADHGIEMGIRDIARIVLKAGNSIEIFFE